MGERVRECGRGMECQLLCDNLFTYLQATLPPVNNSITAQYSLPVMFIPRGGGGG